jgi:hypothetical protein
VSDEPRRIEHWLGQALTGVLELIEQAETPDEILELAVRLNQVAAAIESWEADVRWKLQERMAYITGRAKAQG